MKFYAVSMRTAVDDQFLMDGGIVDAWREGIKPPANYKDPEKKAAYCEERISKQIEDAAKNPLTARIVALGLAELGDEKRSFVWEDPDDEVEVLQAFSRELYRIGQAICLVGWNLRRQWIPVLATRFAIHAEDVTLPTLIRLDSRDYRWVVDLVADLGLDGPMDYWTLRFGVKSRDGDFGSEGERCDAEVRAIRSIAEKLRRVVPHRLVDFGSKGGSSR